MIRRAALIAAMLLAATQAGAAGPVARMTAPNGLSVAGTAERFEVFTRAGSGGRAYFCAAGTFARRLGARATDHVVVVSGTGRSLTRPNRFSVVFAVTSAAPPAEASLRALFLRPSRPGSARSVGHATALCNRS